MTRGEGWTAEFVEQLAQGVQASTSTPRGRSCPKRERDLVLYGSSGKEFTLKWGDGGRWRMEWEGLVNKLMRRFKTTAVRGDAPLLHEVLLATSPARPATASACGPSRAR